MSTKRKASVAEEKQNVEKVTPESEDEALGDLDLDR